MEIEELGTSDYHEAHALWQRTEGMGLSDADGQEAIGRYLRRNPGMSSLAREGGRIVATVLAGHDGRRGYLHHVAVDRAARGRGIGRAVVARSLARLAAEGIDRCHLFLYGANTEGQAFWRALGWVERQEIRLYSKGLTPSDPLASSR